jgi:membrane protease YdiL (CAAX protease family)
VGWEFFHRGFLLFGLRRRIGNLAIFVAAVPFTLEHFAKPEIEAWGSFVAAIALGFLAVRARSFWYGALIHGGVALFMDVVRSWSRLFHS